MVIFLPVPALLLLHMLVIPRESSQRREQCAVRRQGVVAEGDMACKGQLAVAGHVGRDGLGAARRRVVDEPGVHDV